MGEETKVTKWVEELNKNSNKGIQVIITTILFIVAGLCEIGGGWFIWQVIREGKPVYWLLIGFFLLSLYGIIACFQVMEFTRTYAAYGGVFVVLSLLWGVFVDKYRPDKYDIIGACFCLFGASFMTFVPR